MGIVNEEIILASNLAVSTGKSEEMKPSLEAQPEKFDWEEKAEAARKKEEEAKKAAEEVKTKVLLERKPVCATCHHFT